MRSVRQRALSVGVVCASATVSSAQSEFLVIDFGGDKAARFDAGSHDFIDWFCVNHDTGLDGPIQAVFAPCGELYIPAHNTDRVRRYESQTGKPLDDLIGPGAGGLDGPDGIAIGMDGRVYVTSYLNDKVLVFDPSTGSVSTFIEAGNGLDGPFGIAQDSEGDWYVTSDLSDRVLRYDSGGVFIDDSITAGQLGLDGPAGVLIDGETMYVASTNTDSVLVKNLDTGNLSELIAPGTGGLDEPIFVTREPGTDVLIVTGRGGDGQILSFDRTTGAFIGEFLSPGAGGLSGDPYCVAFKPDAVPCYADCDENGVLDFLDFLCFINRFTVGCP